MMSLDKTTSYEELLAWGKRMERYISGDVVFTCELKVDGLAMSLLYESGPPQPGGDEGQRRGGRGRDRQRGHDRGRTRPARSRFPRGGGGAGRNIHDGRGLRRAQCPSGAFRRPDVHQPPQCRRRLPAPEGPRGDGGEGAVVLGLSTGGSGGRSRLQVPPRNARVAEAARLPRERPRANGEDPGGGRPLLHRVARPAAQHRFRDRRCRGQGGRPRPAARARSDIEGPALGHRLQVPARGANDPAQGHHGLHRSHREGDALRRPGARRGRGCPGQPRHLAQRGPGPGQGRQAGRHCRRAPGGRRHPRGTRACPASAAGGPGALVLPVQLPRSAPLRCNVWPGRPTPTASMSTAPASRSSASAISRPGERWT